MKDDRERKFRNLRLVGTLTMVPFMLAAGPLAGFFLGSLLDSWLGTEPVLRYVFLGLGIVAGAREVARMIRQSRKDLDKM
jgi:F0F1-type ATP synthase assembly protein I